MELIRPYRGERFFEIEVCGLRRKLPIVQVGEGVWIASNAELVFGDVEFISTVSEELAKRASRYKPEVLVTPEAKALALAYALSKSLGHSRYVVARKSVKAYMGEVIVEEVKSITTKEPQILVLTKDDAEKITGKRVCLFDDVVSTGGTMTALEKLVKRAGGNVVCKAAVWLEGTWYDPKDLIYLSTLPVFVEKKQKRRSPTT